MIDIYTGTPGSGKSLHCASEIRYHVSRKGKPVILNFPFDIPMCRPRKLGGHITWENTKITPYSLMRFSEIYKERNKISKIKEDEILLVIDEAQIIFNARHWNDKDRIRWIEFFTQHRKMGYHIILVAQYIEMLDKQIRAVIEYEYIHRKVSNIGIGGKILSGITGGNLHIYVKYYNPLKCKVGSEFFHADKSLYELYDSYVIF